jgi:hypothetical protein
MPLKTVNNTRGMEQGLIHPCASVLVGRSQHTVVGISGSACLAPPSGLLDSHTTLPAPDVDVGRLVFCSADPLTAAGLAPNTQHVLLALYQTSLTLLRVLLTACLLTQDHILKPPLGGGDSLVGPGSLPSGK